MVDTNKKYNMQEQIPYESAKTMYLVDDVDNKDLLKEIVLETCKDLPSKIGAKLDSIADIIFVIVAIVKILLVLNLSNIIIIWAFIIVLIKIFNVVCSYIYCKKIILLHTIANKITGFVLFVAPLIIVNADSIIFEITICMIATFSAIQEGHFIRAKNLEKSHSTISRL